LIRLKQEQKQEINGESCLRICLLTAKGTDGSFGGNSANTRGFVLSNARRLHLRMDRVNILVNREE